MDECANLITYVYIINSATRIRPVRTLVKEKEPKNSPHKKLKNISVDNSSTQRIYRVPVVASSRRL